MVTGNAPEWSPILPTTRHLQYSRGYIGLGMVDDASDELEAIDWDDRNGRIIGWVMVDEGIWVNNVMVLTGYAWWFERYAPDDDSLREAQEAAREGKRGLWVEADGVPPWEWRKGVRKL